MATNNSSIGYSPFFHMPLIAGPAEGADPVSHYAAIDATNTTLATFQPDNRISFNLSDQTHATIYAMTGGRVRFYPSGANLPDGSVEGSAAGFGTVGLEPWTADVGQLAQQTPDGVLPSSQPPAYILYGNVGAAEFSDAMESYISEMSVPALRASWSGGGSAPFNRSPLEADFLAQVMTGDTFVFLTGGSVIGAAGPSSAMASDVQLDLAFVDTGTSLFSPQLLLTYLPSIGGAYWGGHPILASMAGSPLSLDIHIRFEMFDMASLSYLPIPEGMEVSMIDLNTFSNDPLATKEADSNGQVHFSSSDLPGNVESEPDIFFLVHTNGQSLGGETLPQEWSTEKWKSKGGNPGYYKDFKGGSIGTASDPLVFGIGLEFHFLMKYKPPGFADSILFPEDVEIHMLDGGLLPGSTYDTGAYRTNSDGEIHGVTFDASPGEDAYLEVHFNLSANPSINMGKVQAVMGLGGSNEFAEWWGSGPDYKAYWYGVDTGIGKYSDPETIILDRSSVVVHLFHLVTTKEWSQFLFQMTGGGWPGRDLFIIDWSISQTAYSWPPGDVHMDSGSFFDRGIMAHELSHQIMWQELGMNAIELVAVLDLKLKHAYNMNSNPIHTLVEGWAEFFEAMFAHSGSSFPYPVSTLDDGSSLDPSPLNKGGDVEGAFANSMWLLFRDHVVTSAVHPNPMVHRSNSGDLSTVPENAWIFDPGVASRFQSLIWNPFISLAIFDPPSSHNFIGEIQSAAGSDWFRIKACFYLMNMGVGFVSASSLTITQGPVAGGVSLAVNGDGFVFPKSFGGEIVEMKVLFGENPGTNLIVTSETELLITSPPGSGPGWVDITVEVWIRGVMATSDTLPSAFEYI